MHAETSGPADPLKVRDFWLDVVKPAARLGKLDKMPTRLATTTRERDTARIQARLISQRSFGMPDGYERIQWRHTHGHGAETLHDEHERLDDNNGA